MFLAVPKLIIRPNKLSYCLSMTQPNTATSMIEKEPMNTQVGLFLDKWNTNGHFDLKDNCYLTFHYFVPDQLNYFAKFCLYSRINEHLYSALN